MAHTHDRDPSGRRHVVVGTFLEGIAGGHWRDPRSYPDGNSNIESFLEFAAIAEQGTLDFAFIADTSYVNRETAWHILSRLEPVTLLSALATRTTHLGLVGTVTTSYTQPYDVARQIASLDRLSGGRAGWNVVTSYLAGHAANFGGGELPDKPARYRIATEFVQVVKALWRSWEPDAFVRDRESGVYVDWSKAHPANHRGEHFSVDGPLNVERSVQGEPVVFQAGSSPEGLELGSREADATFVTAAESLEHGRQRYARWKRAAAAAGRNPDHLLVLQVLNPVVGNTDDQAWAHYEERIRYADVDHALGLISRYFQYFDFSTIDIDAPFPDGFIAHAAGGFTTYAENVLAEAAAGGLTVREAALHHVRPDPHVRRCGGRGRGQDCDLVPRRSLRRGDPHPRQAEPAPLRGPRRPAASGEGAVPREIRRSPDPAGQPGAPCADPLTHPDHTPAHPPTDTAHVIDPRRAPIRKDQA